jgi:PmbA protein
VNDQKLLELCHTLLDLARKAGADHAEAAAVWQRNAETHIENGSVHTVQSGEETMYGLRVLVGTAQGFVTANDLEPALLAERAAEAVAQARVNPADPFFGFPEPASITPVEGIYDAAVDGIGSTETTELAADLLARIRELDGRVRVDSGSVSAGVAAHAIASTMGVSARETSSSVDTSVFGMAVDGDDVASFDYDSAASRRWQGFDAVTMEACHRFVEKCRSGLGARKGESFRGPIVLSPEAVAEFLLPTLTGSLCADTVRKGRSPLASKLAQPVASSILTIREDGRMPGGASSSAFDREGMPIRRRDLVREGVLQGFLYNHYEARAAGGDAASTGNAAGGVSSLPMVGPHWLEIDAGDRAMSELVASGERGIWVGRYSGSTNPVTGDFSGVVKNGFLVQGGERRPLREVLIAGNVYELLLRISAISRERQDIGGSALLPAIRAEDISITAG